MADEIVKVRDHIMLALIVVANPNSNGRSHAKALAAERVLVGGLAPWQLQKVLAEIDAQLGESISGQQLASCIRLSRCHFSRAFRRSMGMSPHSYVMRRRVERAQQLMLSTDATLLEIALECGLSDESHLTRRFVKTLGETPHVWRSAHVARTKRRIAASLPTDLRDTCTHSAQPSRR